MRFALALLLLAGPLVAAPVPKELKKPDDASALVGTWKPVGKNTAWFQFAADGTMRTWHGQPGNSALDWTWTKLDVKATPKRFTLTRAVGQSSYDCVYELSGDALKIIFITDTTKPPPEKVEDGPGVSLYDLVRDKPAK